MGKISGFFRGKGCDVKKVKILGFFPAVFINKSDNSSGGKRVLSTYPDPMYAWEGEAVLSDNLVRPIFFLFFREDALCRERRRMPAQARERQA